MEMTVDHRRLGKSVAFAAALVLWMKLFFLYPLAEEAAAMVRGRFVVSFTSLPKPHPSNQVGIFPRPP
jgi:hypothetical protein